MKMLSAPAHKPLALARVRIAECYSADKASWARGIHHTPLYQGAYIS